MSSVVRIVMRGRALGIDVPQAADREAVAAVLGGFPLPPPHEPVVAEYAVRRLPEGAWTVHARGAETHRAVTLDDTLLALEWQLVTDLLAASADRVHFHGSALADPTGAMTLLVLGESGVGKTTLTLALMAQGFVPHTDDVVLLDPEHLTPLTFPRAFHVDETTRRLVADLPHDPSWETPGLPPGYFLPSAWAGDAAPVGAVIIPKARDHARPLLVGLPVAEAATALLGFSGTLDAAPAIALRTAARITASAPCHALYAGPLAATAELVATSVAGLLRSRPSEPGVRDRGAT